MWLLIGILFLVVCYRCSVGSYYSISDPCQVILPGAVITTHPTTPFYLPLMWPLLICMVENLQIQLATYVVQWDVMTVYL